jgi:hypothetical protein
MTADTASSPGLRGITVDSLRHGVVWLMMALSFIVFIEPAPCDLLFLIVLLLFATSGLRISVATIPLVLLLFLFLIGGLTSLIIKAPNQPESVQFIVISAYMAMASLFFAFYLAIDSERRSKLVGDGWIVGSVFATVFALIGAFDIAGTGSFMSLQGRGMGLFKDPNVYSTYVVLPAVLLFQRILVGTTRHPYLTALTLVFVLAGLFMSFSRGAWINFTTSALLLVLITFVLSQSASRRTRIVLVVASGIVIAGFLLSALLLNSQIRDLFLLRFNLVQYYDKGETGRFGSQLLSIPMLLVEPFGFGPLNFRNILYQDPHNVFINAFASYGWLGGLSYILLTISTFIVGARSLVKATPWQPMAIAAYCVFLTTTFQGVQIDTDHWRHYYWLLGLIWGLYAANLQASGTFRSTTA